MSYLLLGFEPRRSSRIWANLKVGLLGGGLLIFGLSLVQRGYSGAPSFEALRVAEGPVVSHEYGRARSTQLIYFKLGRQGAAFAYPDWAPDYEGVRRLVESGRAPLRIWYSGGAVWQVGTETAILVSYEAMVNARQSSYLVDRVLGVIFSALGGYALGFLALRAWRAVRRAR